MTAPRKAIARKPRTQSPPEPGWPGVVRFALEDWARTARLCVLVVVAGAVLLLAVRLGLHFWLWLRAFITSDVYIETHISSQLEKQVLDLGVDATLAFGFLRNLRLILGDNHVIKWWGTCRSGLVGLPKSAQLSYNGVGLCIL
jgi:hypothetical protein